MSKVAFMIGNGLSIALSKDFSLRTITKKFIESLEGEDKEFLLSLANFSNDAINFDDFESNFSSLEAALESLKRYSLFIRSPVGLRMLERFRLTDPQLEKHEEVIDHLYKSYISKILNLIRGHVTVENINSKLKPFIEFLVNKINNSSKVYIFSLNYDLLIEAILLQYIGTKCFTDFCYPSGTLRNTSIDKFDFNPQRNREIFTSSEMKTELYHLHGSLSLFYDYDRNRAIKLRSADIGIEKIYQKISNNKIPLIPAIITGGGKSEKIVEYPFDFYYRSAKDLCDCGHPNEFYVLGYSFRDKHINDLISRWIKNVEKYEKGFRVVDYKLDQNEKNEFKQFVKSALRKKGQIPNECFQFDGVNAIESCSGTIQKHKADC